ncbi:MAG TPA: bifunctional 4-hydroxy-2-oxoglutarate aldolase/2-dehydro-3-deoxy-phosphogluconate aldolase [Thermomicrobiales bacterium]|nr:bifunctional 4-hydroxy-2-oxoglutarate aldolase/2-dehydro-3-deoxy-phosphogluconate aldolase [Thermomicrobiales bacterium]
MTDTLTRLLDGGVVAIVRLDSAAALQQVAEAVRAGGLTALEYTMTTPGALDALREASGRLGDDMLLGAGTILDPETARAAILAGARFIVTPTLNRDVIALCRRYSVPIIPGAFTPTEILTAWEAGADLVKVFPAGVLGPGYFRDVLAPLPQVRLAPTGGVNERTAPEFFKAGAAAIAVGSALIDRATVAAGDWAEITRRARVYAEIARSARTKD